MSLSSRTLSPSSRSSLQIRLSLFDASWAFVAPFLALLFRGAYILSEEGALTAALYCFVAAGFSLIAFLAFRLRDQMARYFSVHDAIDIVKAVFVAELMIFVVLFTFTRLEGIPRSTPLIHALVLMAGLVGARLLVRLFHTETNVMSSRNSNVSDHILMIGATRLSSLYIKMIETYFSSHHQVIGVLDANPQMLGRTIAGVRVIGLPSDLQPIIDEFAVHGINATRLIIGGDADLLSEPALDKIRHICEERRVRLDFVPELIGLHDLTKPSAESEQIDNSSPEPSLALPTYFRFKRLIDLTAALTLIILALPILLLTTVLALLDVGFPVLFWQQRLGRAGRPFLIYKFRTLRPPFYGHGRPVPEAQRLSWVGALLRRTRLDELPQLLNVLVGDMSLVGPRPLLPEDQPAKSNVRLMVRPGISGWAQVNGGKLLTPKEKGSLDEWYIHNASAWLDIRIIILTLQYLLRNRENQSSQTLATAHNISPVGADEIKGHPLASVPSPRHRIFAKQPRDVQVGHSLLSKKTRGAQVGHSK